MQAHRVWLVLYGQRKKKATQKAPQLQPDEQQPSKSTQVATHSSNAPTFAQQE